MFTKCNYWIFLPWYVVIQSMKSFAIGRIKFFLCILMMFYPDRNVLIIMRCKAEVSSIYPLSMLCSWIRNSNSDSSYFWSCYESHYSTVTDLARFLGQSTLQSLSTAKWYESSCIGITVKMDCKASTVFGTSMKRSESAQPCVSWN